MAKAKKRPSKSAKLAAKLLKESELLAAAKALHEAKEGQDFDPEYAPTNISAANKKRPDKKRG
jgi:hypothetical protein